MNQGALDRAQEPIQSSICSKADRWLSTVLHNNETQWKINKLKLALLLPQENPLQVLQLHSH